MISDEVQWVWRDRLGAGEMFRSFAVVGEFEKVKHILMLLCDHYRPRFFWYSGQTAADCLVLQLPTYTYWS